MATDLLINSKLTNTVANDVMVFNGTTWVPQDGQISPVEFDIRQASDWPANLVDGFQYNVHGPIAMGSVSPILPAAPGRVTICGKGPSASLTSAENNYTMFTDGANSGSIKFENILLTASGTSSQICDLTNNGTGSFVLDRVTTSGCTKVATLSGYNFFSLVRSQDVGSSDGFTLDGNISIISVIQYGSFGLVSGGTMFKSGASLSVTNRAGFEGVFDLPTGSTFCDISASEIALDAGLQVAGGSFTGLGTFFSNIDEKNVKSRWIGNTFPSIPPDNTHVGGGWHIALSGDETINSTTPTVYLKVNGTTTPLDLQWFSDGTANDLTSDSTRSINVTISGTIYFEGTNNATIQCKLVKDDGTPEDIFELGEIEFTSTNAPIAYPIAGITTVITSAATVIELHAKSSSGSFTAKVHSNLQISERS